MQNKYLIKDIENIETKTKVFNTPIGEELIWEFDEETPTRIYDRKEIDFLLKKDQWFEILSKSDRKTTIKLDVELNYDEIFGDVNE